MSISKQFQCELEDGDLYFSFSKWPPIAKEYMLKLHKTRNERYYLTRFLAYNGLKPEIASLWIMREGDYDEEARRDQAGLTQKAKTVEFFRKGRIFNMRLGRTDTADEVPTSGTPPPPSTPVTQAPPAVVTWAKLVERFPLPRREHFDDDFDYRAASMLWHHETKAAINKWKSQGLIMDF